MTTDATPGDGATTDHSPYRRALRIALLILGCAIVASAALTLVDTLRVAREIGLGRARFSSIVRFAAPAEGTRLAEAEAGVRRFETARRMSFRSPWIGIWARIPMVGRPARWLRAATLATESLSKRGARAIRRLEPGLESFGRPSSRLAFIQELEAELRTFRAAVREVRLPPTGGFLPPVVSAERQLRADLARVRSAVSDGIAATRGLWTLLKGPSTYLVLASNNAEMRAGGMVLQAGLLRSVDGRMAAGGFRSTASLALKTPVPLPAQIEALYGWLSPGTEWRNVGSSPNFPAVAPVYASMAERVGVPVIDGVLQLDVVGVRALLAVVGPVEVSGRRYDAANVERLVLHDLYVTFGGEQVERRQDFSRLAAATFQALNERPWRLEQLGRALRSAVLGRHLLAWSRRPSEQQAWRRLRLDGSLERDGMMLTVQNHAANKLDWFLRPSMDLRVERRADGWRRVRLRIRVQNPTPPGEPTYVEGDGSLVPRGDHRALVAVYLPGWATNVEMPGRKIAIVGPDGPMRVIGTRIDIPRGGSVSLDVGFSAPPDVGQILLLPSARGLPVPLRIGLRSLDDAVPRSVPL